MTEPGDGAMTELYDADVPRVDLVGKAANGVPRFLFTKAMMTPDQVRALIAKEQEMPVVNVIPPGATAVTVDGATIIGKAQPVHPDAAQRRRDAADGDAMPDGSYPIPDKAAVTRAVHAVGRGSGSHDAIRRHIISRAKSLGAESEIPDDWNADGTVKKADVDALPDADEVQADLPASEQLDGDPDDPDSPAWEAVDAARAGKAIDLALALRQLVCQAQEREQQEAAGAEPGDAANAADLADVLAAVDCIIGVLAPFAVCEQAEADERQADIDALTKGRVRKAGRVLSSVNETRIQHAAAELAAVLASLPPKEPAVPDATQPAVKAAGDAQLIVYDADGNAVGVADPDDIIPIATLPQGDTATAAADAADGSDAADPGTVGDDVASADVAAQPPADAGIPADEAAPEPAPAPPAEAPAPKPVDDVEKRVAELVKAAIDEQKAADAALVKALEDRIAHLEAPAQPKVLTNGALPPPHLMRGQDAAAPADPAAGLALRKQLAESRDAGEQRRLADQLNELAAAELARLHATR